MVAKGSTSPIRVTTPYAIMRDAIQHKQPKAVVQCSLNALFFLLYTIPLGTLMKKKLALLKQVVTIFKQHAV